MLNVVIGHSEAVQTLDAANEVINQITASLADVQPQAGVLFCSVDFNHILLLSIIRAAFPAMELIGCTTDGEFSSVLGFTEDSLTLLVFASDVLEIKAGVGRELIDQGAQAGREAALSAQKKLNHRVGEERFAIILEDTFHSAVYDVNKEIQSVFSPTFPIVGVGSATHLNQRQTFQFYNDEVLTDSVVVLLFAGPVAFSYGSKGEFMPLGSKELVTKCQDNVLYRIGDKTAIDYLRKYTGGNNLFLDYFYCLAVQEKDSSSYYFRLIPNCDPQKGTVTLNGRIPEGATVQFGTIDRGSIPQSCKESIYKAKRSYPANTQPAAALFFSCTCRKLIMGTKITNELQTIEEQLPSIPFAGFYCFGEFCPSDCGLQSMFNGYTFVTLLIGPAEES